ncbi:hypothetical protein QFC20_006691 [Naganishia adeliensis]|uniref:Uncharacterized protein n=1 Tax=Naganishia adeliensis TaxID=92952 RepID=A0ACC2V780_9TREE|nr:hypothetical protein QFC20_006691 [Naganishia adeliensis]
MGNRSIHPDTQRHAVEGSYDARLPDRVFRRTLGGISTRTVQRAKKRFEETGTYAFDISNKGRRRSLDRSVVDHITFLAQQDASITIKQVQKSLEEIGIAVHETTIRRTLKRQGFTFKQLVKTARERSEYTIIPALTWEGYIALEALEGAADGQVFGNFLVEQVVRVRAHVAYLHYYNPIEESFSCWKAFIGTSARLRDTRDPYGAIEYAAQQAITSEKAIGWIAPADCNVYQ